MMRGALSRLAGCARTGVRSMADNVQLRERSVQERMAFNFNSATVVGEVTGKPGRLGSNGAVFTVKTQLQLSPTHKSKEGVVTQLHRIAVFEPRGVEFTNTQLKPGDRVHVSGLINYTPASARQQQQQGEDGGPAAGDVQQQGEHVLNIRADRVTRVTDPAAEEQNAVKLLGGVLGQPRSIGNNTGVAFTLATQSSHPVRGEEAGDQVSVWTQLHRVCCFDPDLLETILAGVAKGCHVYVEGRINYERVALRAQRPSIVAEKVSVVRAAGVQQQQRRVAAAQRGAAEHDELEQARMA